MKHRFLQYFSIFMLMMFTSNITLANLYALAPKSDNPQETTFSTQKIQKSFWAKLASVFASELEETEEKNEKETEENTKNAAFQQVPNYYLSYSSFEFQKHLFATQINEWTHNHVPQLKAKINKAITLSLHRFRL